MQAIQSVSITLEEYGERGRRLREVVDQAQWALGDLALEVISAYGLSAVDEWAKDVGIGRSTAYEYKAMCVFYEQSARADYLDMPMLTYSHFRVAKRLNSVVLAYELLDIASRDGMSVDELTYYMFENEPYKSIVNPDDEPDDDDGEPEPTPILSEVPVVVDEIDMRAGCVTLRMSSSYLDMLAEEKKDEFLLTLTRR